MTEQLTPGDLAYLARVLPHMPADIVTLARLLDEPIHATLYRLRALQSTAPGLFEERRDRATNAYVWLFRAWDGETLEPIPEFFAGGA